jgi:hypothetical protein
MTIIKTLPALVILAGCADHSGYYAAIKDQLVLQQQQQSRQAAAEQAYNLAVMASYTDAMTRAAQTPAASDDLAVAFLFTQLMQPPPAPARPAALPEIKPPPSGPDYIRAASPVIQSGLAWGLGAWGLGKIVDGLGSTTTYTLDNGAIINQDSGNAGSFNQGGDISTTAPVIHLTGDQSTETLTPEDTENTE